MSRKKKRSKSMGRIPVVDSLIDLAAAATFDFIAAERREKYGKRRGGKTDPYAAAGAAMGMGRLNNTNDLLRLGGVLGAMGAFDENDELYINPNLYSTPRDNRHAWRLNCEDGSAYGVDPEDFETRDAYNAALYRKKTAQRDSCDDGADHEVSPEGGETKDKNDEAPETAKSDDHQL